MPVRAPPPLPQHDATWLTTGQDHLWWQKLSWMGEQDEPGTNRTLWKQSFIEKIINSLVEDQAVEQVNVEVTFEERRNVSWSHMRFI